MFFDATHEADTICVQCGIQLTKANHWSSWLCVDCHDAEMDARGAHRPALLEAMRRYNQPKISSLTKAVGAAFLVLVFGGVIHFRNVRKKGETVWNK